MVEYLDTIIAANIPTNLITDRKIELARVS